jgi:UDP-N-acetylglucosamine 2-epimerase (non-hydrolysing)
VQLTEPLNYLELTKILQSCKLVWSVSGGIQEECLSFKKPVLILRNVTERPEVVDSGFGKLVGTNIEAIVNTTK